MTGTKKALLVGYNYDNNSSFLPVPATDNIAKLATVLRDPEIGGFDDPPELLDMPLQEVIREVESFFKNGHPDDLLLLYFSGHGVLDPWGQLCLATPDTNQALLGSTAISAREIKKWMDRTGSSKKIVLLLDCCHGGAIARGNTRRRDRRTEEALERLGGEGKIVIAAAHRLGLAFDSAFTDAVVTGLDTGDADLDGDGNVSVDELYKYVCKEVQEKHPNQRPIMHGTFDGELILATNQHRLMPLPSHLEQHLSDEQAWKRKAAAYGLGYLISGDHPPGQKRMARRRLHQLCKDDPDRGVRSTASQTLRMTVPPRVVPHETTRQRSSKAARALILVAALVISPPAATWWLAPPISIPCSPVTRYTDGVLSLGTLLPNNTGEFVYTGPALNAGVQLAMKEITDAGGIPGIADVKLDAINQKDEGDPSKDTANQSTDALLTNQVDVIIGPATSAVGLKVINKVTCAGVILFSPSNTSRVFTTYPDHGLYFRTAPPVAAESTVLGKLVAADGQADGKSGVVVMSRDDAYGNDLREATVAAIRESGGRVLDSFNYDPNTGNFDKIIKRVKDKNPDAIVLVSFAESARILAGMIQQGLGPKDKRIYGSNSNMNDSLAGQVDRQNPGVLAGMKGTVPDPGDEMFLKRLREIKPGLRNVSRAAQVYDAVIITALAAAAAHTDAPSAIAREINGVTKDGEKCYSFVRCLTLVIDHKNIAYIGPSGPLQFSDSGEPRSTPYRVSEFQVDGTVKIIR